MSEFKKRILIVGDKSVAKTGFAMYKKNLLKRLHANDNYEVAEYAFAGILPEKKQVPWKYYSTSCINQNEDGYAKFQEKPQLFKNGIWRWDACVNHFRPHIVLCLQDIWMASYILFSSLNRFYKTCCTIPIDSDPQSIDWIQATRS